MITYEFKTQEAGIDNKTRTIVKREEISATTKDTEFRLEEKEKELKNAEQSLVDTQKRIDELKIEIAEIKRQLNIV